MNTSTCANCGSRKQSVAEYPQPQCAVCTTVKEEATREFALKHPDAPMSDALYAGRVAMTGRAHTAHSNTVSPRAFAATRGTMPVRPEKGVGR